MYCSGNNLKELLSTTERELKILKTWFDVNKLSLNIKKTKFMVFRNRKEIDKDIKLKICDSEIERVTEIKFLGVVIDDKLTWKQHVRYIKGKISKSIAILYKSRSILNYKALHIIYCSLILPYISYCVEVWGSTYKTTVNAIVLLQKRAIRLINKVDFYEHTDPLFKKTHVMKFKDLVYYKTMQIMYKAKSNLLPVSIQRFFSTQETKYNLRDVCKFIVPRAKKEVKRRCISVVGVSFWNDANINLRMCSTFMVFKKMVYCAIFECY